jgi:hypothetical protein
MRSFSPSYLQGNDNREQCTVAFGEEVLEERIAGADENDRAEQQCAFQSANHTHTIGVLGEKGNSQMHHVIDNRPHLLLMAVLSDEIIIDAVEEQGQCFEDDHGRHDVVDAVNFVRSRRKRK